MSETIPDAIMAEADEICSQIAEFGMPAQETIAQAILSAEKRGMERAAKIAEDTTREICRGDYMLVGAAGVGRSIASAIRKGAS